MKLFLRVFVLGTIFFFSAYLTLSAEPAQEPQHIDNKPYHEDLDCESCHTDPKQTFPADFVCLDCHDSDEVVAATERPEEEKWQNPHNNLHYGKDVPCMECHGEHETGEILCDRCHSFEYPNFKP